MLQRMLMLTMTAAVLSTASLMFGGAGLCAQLSRPSDAVALEEPAGPTQEFALGPPEYPAYKFGQSVCSCDLDNDGIADWVIGAPYHYPAGVSDPGRVFIYSGANGYLIKILEGDSHGYFGCSVDCAGDVNADGKQDLVVGAPYYSNRKGKYYVYSGVTFALLHADSGSTAGDQLGRVVRGAGDVNHDGKSDIIVSAPGRFSGAGRIEIILGNIWEVWHSNNGDNSGDSSGLGLAAGRDIDNDGTADYVVGAPYWDGVLIADKGRAYVRSGSTGDLLCIEATCTKEGATANEHLGYSIALADVNGDGHADIIVGAPGFNDSSGAVAIYNGWDYVLFTTEGVLYGGAPGDEFGYCVAYAGDLNDDGKDDFAVGAPGYNSDAGRVCTFWREALIDGFTQIECYDGEATWDRFGTTISGAGDVDDDGNDDILVGAIYAGCPGNPGMAYIMAGDDDDVLYALHPGAMLILDTPANDTVICGGTTYEIQWHEVCQSYESDSAELQFSYDGGQTWPDTIRTPNDGSYDWTPLALDLGSCFVRVAGTGCDWDLGSEFGILTHVGNADGSNTIPPIDIDDVVYLISHIFGGGPPPTPFPVASGDANCSCGVDVDDIVYLINRIWNGGPAPCSCEQWIQACGPVH